ncbi:MAG TPA: hypothetical protein VKB31_02810 [Trueperaceae bacterium]|nr:hypothetical protein [Trueperaceae bacterium]
MADDLTHDLYYLAAGREDAAGVVVLEGPEGRWVPLFSTAEAASALAAEAPAGVRVACAPAGDPRAREELLLACLHNGAEVLALDPDARDATAGTPDRVGSVRLALAAVRSYRNGSACL